MAGNRGIVTAVFTDELYTAARPLWDAQLEHPFVRGLGDGTLPEEIFARWVLQDYRYLIEFSRVFAFAAAKADTLESMSWYAAVLNLTLNSEMALHRQYAARFGIDQARLEAEPMWPTNRAYTDFLVRTAAAGDLAELVAALLPCAWGYVHLAAHLAKQPPPADPRYTDWIAQYTAPEFVEANEWLKSEMNRLAADAGEQKRRRLREIFLLSSDYELRFWQMCWGASCAS
ncbi:MAG TPA: thiaminase II [Thermoanaerobaculia bacterium]|nr:thiaminase II [Thermoanaerobaculia bacterium]